MEDYMQKQSYSPKAIAETGIMFVIIMLITLITTTIPVLAFIGMFILPIPIILLYIRYNYKVAFTAVIMSIIVTSLFFGGITALASGISYGLTGCAFGYCIKNKRKSTISLIVVSISILLGNIITYLIYALFIGKQGILNTLNSSIEVIRQYYIDLRNVYIQQSGSPDIVSKINEIINQINLRNMLIILPIVFIINSLIQGYINYLITYKILTKLRYNMEKPVSFSEIYISNRVVALTIIITCLGVMLKSRGIIWGGYLGSIFQNISMMLIIIDGMSYLTHLLRRRYKISRGVTITILIIGFLMPLFQDLYLVLGSADILLNLRGFDPNPIRKVKSRE
ncbi:hypothetical protein Z968_07370 [Clostridium novyi A str. 4552]|uniref:DUF2232 domain-containing protein n=2 Tax=Clostridium novyi TaxID=1542 RepID=A0A0A0I692_CLONO|nr:hypothetical protein Z968_07370 [Clostridium novyi A str. 4552]